MRGSKVEKPDLNKKQYGKVELKKKSKEDQITDKLWRLIVQLE